MYGALRQALFALDPERAHAWAARTLAPLQRSPALRRAVARDPDPRLASHAFGTRFAAPVGVAAGFDKEGHVYNALLTLGFGHVELGTVTPRPQPGNPRPRIERHPRHQALVNRMGFPGPGATQVARRLATKPPIGPLGVNIGPNKDTAAEDVAQDLATAAVPLTPLADYLAINVSSPNTPGLRALQKPKAVARLVAATLSALEDTGTLRPVLVKLHPDAADKEMVATARAAVDAGAAGIIATNTTRDRPRTMQAIEGGLSGRPLHARAVEAVASLHHALPDVPLVGVGGVFTAADAIAMLRAGASLVQLYTGLIYEGPFVARRIHAGILEELDRYGLDRVDELTGVPAA